MKIRGLDELHKTLGDARYATTASRLLAQEKEEEDEKPKEDKHDKKKGKGEMQPVHLPYSVLIRNVVPAAHVRRRHIR